MSEKQKVNPFVAIAGTIGGISIGIVAITAIYANQHFAVVPWLIGALAVMGIFLGFMAGKKQ